MLGTIGVFKGPPNFILMTAAVIGSSAGWTSVCQSLMHWGHRLSYDGVEKLETCCIWANQCVRFSDWVDGLMMLYEVREGTRFSVSLPQQIQLKGGNALTWLCACLLASHCSSFISHLTTSGGQTFTKIASINCSFTTWPAATNDWIQKLGNSIMIND